MSKGKILTKEIAEQFLKDEQAIHLSEFTSIEPDAAERLSNRVEDLDLGGIKVLPATVAAALGKHEGRLYLGGIKTLSPEAAKGLAKHKGCLDLENLDALSSLAAQALSKFEGDLFLGLKELDGSEGHVALASSLARCENLELPELTSLSDESALALSKRRGGQRFRLGLESLSDSPAKAVLAATIAKLPPNSWVILDNLTFMTDDFAEALGRRGGWLSLRGLKNLSDKAAKFLSSLKTLDISKEGKTAINKAKKTSACANKTKPTRSISAGCPEGAFEWILGGVLAVKASGDTVERLAEKVGLEHEVLPNAKSAPWCLLNGVGVFHKTPEGFDDIANFMADHFKAMAVHLWCDDTTGITGYTIWDAEKKKETYTTEGDFESNLPNKSKSQKLLKTHKGIGFIDARFKQLGIQLPNELTQ
ncbi:MAG: hypothetical protein U1F81_25075 [Verrucomicrobiaceae bacterium]